MYQINFDSPVHVHFIGIGGISMSGLAEVLLQEGFTISGSDSQRSELTRHLEEKGATVFYGQTADNIKPGIDVVVYTAAIHPDNAEFAAARSAGIPMLTRAELLGEIMRNYKTAIAVAGTHGKTTTTSMISMILLEAQADPTISVGGILPEIGGNIRVGRSDLFLTGRPPGFLQGSCRYPPLLPSFCRTAPGTRAAGNEWRNQEHRRDYQWCGC